RDIKPGNIMIADDLTVTVLDFGLAARIRTTMSVMSVPIDNSSGTPAYKSPEQWKSVPSKAASDQYSLAVLAHEMLTGYLPFENDDLGVLRESVIHIAPERPDDISDQAWNALQKALSKAPAERFESCTAFVNALFSEAKAPERKIEQPAPKPEQEPVPGDKFVFAETESSQTEIKNPMKAWFKSFYKGRASRKEYWFYQLRWWLCNFFLASIFAFIWMRTDYWRWDELYIISLCWSTVGLLVLTIPSWTDIAVRRLHDVGESGRNLYWIFLPVIGWGKLLYDCCNYSTPGTNQYGKTKEFSFKKLYSPWFFGIVTFLFILIPSTRLLAQRALCECGIISTVSIPSGIVYMPWDMFSGCTGLTSVNIPDSVTEISCDAFSGCTGLTSVNIPNSVTKIERKAFYGCTGLTSVNIPNSVTEIGRFAFSGCTGLTSVNIPDSVTEISCDAFSGCTGLTSINIPNSVREIGVYAFSGCTGLTSINIPNSVTVIMNDAFSGCTGLTSVNIPNSVTVIKDGAFSGCTNLKQVSIPKNCSIADDAFPYDCTVTRRN
ncbi:MAG: leucine-rich repeat protein, partial [Lentisphaeria bacterium]|nr:leucine-rich repeat protein [Lentisphaeria bacterium]